MRISRSFFIAHWNYLQAFFLSCPSAAILGELSKLQLHFGFSCSRQHHPCKCWEMSGAVLTNSFAGAQSQTEHLPQCRWCPFLCFPGERERISRVCCNMDLEGTAALRAVLWGFNCNKSCHLHCNHTQKTTNQQKKGILAYNFSCPQSSWPGSLWVRCIPAPQLTSHPVCGGNGQCRALWAAVWRAGQVQTGLPHIADLTNIPQLFNSHRFLVLGGWPLFYIFPFSNSVAPSISYNGLRPDIRKTVFCMVIKWCPWGKHGDIAPPSVKEILGIRYILYTKNKNCCKLNHQKCHLYQER